jgi:UDP:flavonoid glycosyltransferase YjiC (YdhE family)
MSRMFCAWELGGGTGHLHFLGAIGQELRARGNDVTYVLKDLVTASRFAAFADARLLQAPTYHRVSRLPPAINYAEILNRVGYLDVDTLTTLIGAWRELLRLVGPDLVIVDHSPTALIAARLENLPRAAIGSGFFVPPRVTPMPSMQPWRDISDAVLAKSEDAVLQRINQALDRHGGTALETLSDIFDLDATFLCVLPEFDHYRRMSYEHLETPEYFGPLDMPGDGGDVPWPSVEGDRIFVYYRLGYPHFKTLMRQLAGLGLPTLVVADDAPPSVIEQFSTDSLHIITRQVDLGAVAQTCRVAIGAAGLGSVTRLALGGCPLLMLPVTVEQSQLAYRLARAGLGIMNIPDKNNIDFCALVRDVLARPEFAERARALAQRYQKLDPARQITRIVERCENLSARRQS